MFIGGVPIKRATKVLAGLLIDDLRRCVLLDPAVAQQDHPVGHGHGLGLVVGDIDHG